MKMNEMKKRTCSCLMAALLMTVSAFGLAGCGTEPSSAKQDNAVSQSSGGQADSDKEQAGTEQEAQQQAEESAQGYLFESNGVSIGVDMDMEPIAEALGEPKSVFEQPSCAGQGTAFLYTYSGFEINTYPDGETNYIAYILLKDDTVATPEGVDLSMTKADIIAAYGEDYTEEENKITYEKGNMTLNFLLEGDSIISIEYDSGVLN